MVISIGEARLILEAKRKEGYVTHEIILDTFAQNGVIEESLFNLCYTKPKPREINFICGPEFYQKFGIFLEGL